MLKLLMRLHRSSESIQPRSLNGRRNCLTMQAVYLKASVVLNWSMRRVTRIGCMPRSGNLTWNWIGLKKVWTQPVVERQAWIEPNGLVALSTQCKLLAVTRSVVYDQKKRPQKALDELECILLNELDEEYTRHPFYGTRRMTKYLCGRGYAVNRKRVQRLMQTLGLAGMAPGPNTSKPHPQHKIYPYLLRGLHIIRPNQVWSTDITYIRLRHGFVYLVALSLTGTAARYCHGGCRTRWMQGSVSIVLKKPSRLRVHRRSSIPTKARNLPASVSPAY